MTNASPLSFAPSATGMGSNVRKHRTDRANRGLVWMRRTVRALRSMTRFLVQLPTRVLLLLIIVYQRTLSPVLPVIFGAACGCRFSPTCSHYAAEALRTHGALVGVLLAAIRLVKCTPLHSGGFDPVPARRARKFRCDRTA